MNVNKTANEKSGKTYRSIGDESVQNAHLSIGIV